MTWSLPRSTFTVALLILLAGYPLRELYPSDLFAQPPPADCLGDVKPARSKHPYRPLDNRCEGEYSREVSSTLDLLSLSLGPLPKPTGTNTSLLLSWFADRPVEVNLVGRVLDQNKYYRMDARLGSKLKSFSWALSQLQDAGYATSRLAIVASAHAPSIDSATSGQTLVLPVRASFDGTPSIDELTTYYAILTSGDEVESLRASLVDSVGGVSTMIWKDRLLVEGPFAPTYPITVKIPISSRGRGIYRLELVARTRMNTLAPLLIEMLHE
jgi:hypothetical protein